MKPYSLIVISFLVLVSLIIIPVSAQTLNGSITSTQWVQTTYTQSGVTSSEHFHQLGFQDIEKSANLISIVRWEHQIGSIDAGAPAGVSIPVTVKLCNTWSGNACSSPGATIGTGDLGYQRFFDVNGNEMAGGYQYFVVNTLNVTGLSGAKLLYLEYTNANFYNKKTGTFSGDQQASGSVCFSGQPSGANPQCVGTSSAGTLVSKDVGCTVSYTVTKPAGIGIAGSVQKTSGSSRMYLYDGATGAQLANEQVFSSFNYWYFSTNKDTIIIGMLNSGGTQVNTSTLFSVTPTPTPTGAATSEPGTWSNISFTTQYVNGTKIANVFVKLKMYYESSPLRGDDDWQQAVDGYTDANGYILFQEVDLDGWDFKATFDKPGIQYFGMTFNPAPYTHDMPVYLFPTVPGGVIPGLPSTINVTLQVKSATTYQPIPSAWVTIGDSISGTSYVGQSTNATGYVIFPGVPNTANINGQITKAGYTPLTYWVTSGSLLEGDQALTKYLYLSSATVTPTITPVVQEGVSLTASPNSVAPGQSTTLTMTCANVTACTGAGGMHVVTYSEKYPDPSWDTHTIAIFHYNTSNSKYDYRPNADVPWQYGTWTGLVATGTPTISGINTYYVNAMRDDYYSIGQANVGVLVTGAVAGNLNMKLASQDQTTGGHLYNYQMNLTNRNTGAITEFNTVVYEVNKLLPRGQDYTVQCSKSGYLPGSQNFQVPTDPNIVDGTMGTFVNCPLYPTGSISAGNTTVTVKVFDAENYLPLPNVQVQMSAPVIYSDSPKYTGGDGAGVFFVLGQNQPYSVTASKTGYCAVTETGNTSTLDTKNVYLNLKYGSCMGPTPTHTPTPGPTPGPTGTTPGVIVTPTTFQPGNATTFWRPWINVFTSMGANTGEINMLLAGLIIVLLMAVGGGVAGVLGAEVFMGFGAIFCVAVGLIPIWVVLAIITLGFLFYGLKIGR